VNEKFKESNRVFQEVGSEHPDPAFGGRRFIGSPQWPIVAPPSKRSSKNYISQACHSHVSRNPF